jgi:hypothetical protein
MQRSFTLASALALTLVLAGCGMPQVPRVDTTQVGMIALMEVVPAVGNGQNDTGLNVGVNTLQNDVWTGLVDGTGLFIETEEALPDWFLADPFDPVVGTCEVVTFGELEDEFFALPTWDIQATTSDAGEQLTLTTADGETFAVMLRDEVVVDGETWYVYGLDDVENVQGPLPGDLRVSVPGAEFPAFDSVAFPTTTTFALTAPAFVDVGTITGATEFAWEAAQSAAGTRSIVVLQMVTGDPEAPSFVTCYAPDADGTFTFPAETVAELPAGFEAQLELAGRFAYRSVDAPLEGARLYTARGTLVVYGDGFAELPNGELPNGELPNGELPNGEVPNGELPNGAVDDTN